MNFALDRMIVLGPWSGSRLGFQLLATIGITSSLLAHKLSPTKCKPVWGKGMDWQCIVVSFFTLVSLDNQSEQFFLVVIANNEDRAINHELLFPRDVTLVIQYLAPSLS